MSDTDRFWNENLALMVERIQLKPTDEKLILAAELLRRGNPANAELIVRSALLELSQRRHTVAVTR